MTEFLGRLVPLAEVSKTNRHLNYQHLLGLVRDGVLPAVRIGRRLFIDLNVVEEWARAGGSGFAGGWRRKPKA